MNWKNYASFWPNAAASRFVTVAPHRWHLQEAGAGPTLLLLHGAGASTHSWRALLPDLARDHHVVAIDLPGQGFTRLGDRSRCGVEAMAADIAAMLRSQAITPDAIVGHSAGAAIACRMALDAPCPVVAINGALNAYRGPAGPLFQSLAKLLALNPLTAAAFSRIAGTTERVRKLIASTGSQIDAEGIELYRLLVSDRGHVDATLRMMSQWNLTGLIDALPRLRAPCLLLTGDQDQAVPPEVSDQAAARLRDARRERFAGFGHLLHEEDPARVSASIRAFLVARRVEKTFA